MQLVVVTAVNAAVRAATITFATTSQNLDLFIISTPLQLPPLGLSACTKGLYARLQE